MSGHKRGALVLLAITALMVSCKKESEDTKDAGPTATSPVQMQLASRIFSLAHSYDAKANGAKEGHHLDGTNRKALIYFEAHASQKDTLNWLKVVQDAVTGTHRTFGGRLAFSTAGARMTTDYDCPATISPSGSTLATIFGQMSACSTKPDMGPPDQGAPDVGSPDLGAMDSAVADKGAADLATADAAAPDAAADAAAVDKGAVPASGTLYTLKVNDETDNRLFVEDATARMTLSRIFRKKPTIQDQDTLKLLNVWERVTHQNSCDATDPMEYLVVYTDDKGKVLYTRVIDNYSKNGTYGVEEGTVSSRSSELTFNPAFKGDCKSKVKLNLAKRPIFPPNLWLTTTNCTKQSAEQEVYYSTSSDRKCSAVDVTGLALKGLATRTYISRKGTAYPATSGTAAHVFWSIFTGG